MDNVLFSSVLKPSMEIALNRPTQLIDTALQTLNLLKKSVQHRLSHLIETALHRLTQLNESNKLIT